MSSRSRTPEELKLIQEALKRLKSMMKQSPRLALKVHSRLNRQKGVELLSDLLNSDAPNLVGSGRSRFC